MDVETPILPDSPDRCGRGLTAVDLVVLLLLGVAWYIYVGPIVMEEQLRGYDVFRDVASAVNILHGRFFADPAYVGETIWYPPLGAALAAGVSRWFDVPPTDYFRWSQLLFNWLIPAGMYVVVLAQWGRRAAIVAMVALVLAMPWWQVEIAHGQPSIHAVVWGWVSVWLFAVAERHRSYGWAVVCGGWQGLSFWHHPLLPAVLGIAFVLFAVWARFGRGSAGGSIVVSEGKGMIGRAVVTAGITLLIATPILYMILHGPVLNTDPREFLAAELGTVRFALMRGDPWVWGMGIIGVVACTRRADLGSRLLLCVLLVTLLGQVPGYIRWFGGDAAKFIPTIVPHEFQRLFQLGWAMAIGVGVDAVIGSVTAGGAGLWRRVLEQDPVLRTESTDHCGGSNAEGSRGLKPAARNAGPGNTLAAGALTIAACLLTGVWWVGDVPENLRRYLKPMKYPQQWVEASEWVRENTDFDDVFACQPDIAFRWLNATTGRKVWITQPGHSNPRVDWIERAAVMRRMRDAPTVDRLWGLARINGIRYLVPSPGWNPVALRGYTPESPAADYVHLIERGRGALPIFEVLPRDTDSARKDAVGTP